MGRRLCKMLSKRQQREMNEFLKGYKFRWSQADGKQVWEDYYGGRVLVDWMHGGIEYIGTFQ